MDVPIFSDTCGPQGVTLLVIRPHPDDGGSIRAFRPLVMVTEPPGGLYAHPDHIMCSRVRVDAFHAAGDADAYPEAGPLWQVAKLYAIAQIDDGCWDALRPEFKAAGIDTAFLERRRHHARRAGGCGELLRRRHGPPPCCEPDAERRAVGRACWHPIADGERGGAAVARRLSRAVRAGASDRAPPLENALPGRGPEPRADPPAEHPGRLPATRPTSRKSGLDRRGVSRTGWRLGDVDLLWGVLRAAACLQHPAGRLGLAGRRARRPPGPDDDWEAARR